MMRRFLAWLSAGAVALATPLTVTQLSHAYPPSINVGQCAGYPALQTETTAWVAQVVTNGGTVTALYKCIIDQYIIDLKAGSNYWTNAVADIWWTCAENSIQALTSLKGLRLATAQGSPTFVAMQGFTTNGSSSYLDTTFNPSTSMSPGSASDLRVGVYETVNNNGGSVTSTGARTGSTDRYGINSRQSNTLMALSLLNNTVTNTLTLSPASDSRGYSVAALASATRTGYKNGSSLGTVSPGATGASLPNAKVFVGAMSASNTAAEFRTMTVCEFDYGKASTVTESTMFTIQKAMAKRVGAYTP